MCWGKQNWLGTGSCVLPCEQHNAAVSEPLLQDTGVLQCWSEGQYLTAPRQMGAGTYTQQLHAI